MSRPKIGLLPLYIKLYDDACPELRAHVENFQHTLEEEFRKRSVAVVTAGVCRIREEFAQAVARFEDSEVDAIVTIHLAYSPSLESAEILAKARLPIIILDTTPDFEFGPSQIADRINFNHGIHGVQDLCNLLLRHHKPFRIEAGHWGSSDVIDRVVSWVKAAHLASVFKKMRVGRIGKPFKGMGDFFLPPEKMRDLLGIETVDASEKELRTLYEEVTEQEISQEKAKDQKRFENHSEGHAYNLSLRTGIALRKWIGNNDLSAFTFNFLSIDKDSGLPAAPFLEAGKALSAGIGYAGEGDVLTAALVATLLSAHHDSTFVEMFCPDWQNDCVFISHMGEMNINLSAVKPSLYDIDFPYTNAERPVIAAGRYRAGKAVLVNLAPGPDDTFSLIVVPVEMQDVKGADTMQRTIRGWFRPPMNLQKFLPAYSRLGGTHHSALVYGDAKEDIVRFGQINGWSVKTTEN